MVFGVALGKKPGVFGIRDWDTTACTFLARSLLGLAFLPGGDEEFCWVPRELCSPPVIFFFFVSELSFLFIAAFLIFLRASNDSDYAKCSTFHVLWK